jgi:hypothetical protein
MSAATQPTPAVFVQNQFGAAVLATGQPNLLCLPSWKSLKGPPTQKAPQPPGISHFTCYPVSEIPGTGGYKVPPGIMLQDQFAPKPVAVEVSPVPAELCLPTVKVVGKKVFRIVNPVPHLLCFPVSQTPNITPVWDKNQFGTSKIAIGPTKWLCLPSNKRIVSPPPVDHHLCYLAHGAYRIPPGVKLFNQFSPKGFVPKIGPVILHCNPVAKTIVQTNQTFPITNQAAHLLCFRIFATRQPVPHLIQVSNQFGSGMLVPGQPNILCLPSWKGLRVPPKMTVPQPPGLSHFTCYPVHEAAGTGGFNPPPILLQDQFAPKPVQVGVKPEPVELCLPTKKTVGKAAYPIINPMAHLLCFAVTQTPRVTPVFDQNQFGTSRIAIIGTKWLCLPSTKKIIQK